MNKVSDKLKPYPAYKPSNVEWMGEIPDHWDVKKLKYFSQIVNGSTPKSGIDEYWDGDIVWVTPNDLGKSNGNRITDSSRKITTAGLNSCGTTITPKNSIILSSRAPIGHLGITDIETCTNQGCKTIVPDISKSNYIYLYYYLLASKNNLQSLGQGSTFVELSSQNLKDFENPFPSLFEQQSIAVFLDRKTHQIDTLIEKKQRQIELLKEQRSAVINQAVTKGLDPDVQMKDSGIEWLGEIPEHWEIIKLKYCVQVINEKTEDVNNYSFKIALENVERFTGKLINGNSQFEGLGNIFKKGDVLFNKLRPYLCKATLATQDGVAVGELLVFRATKFLDNKFLLFRVDGSGIFKLLINSQLARGITHDIKGKPFNFICEIIPELDTDCAPVEYMPQSRYKNSLNIPLHEFGQGPFCRFKIPNKYSIQTGIQNQ